jgi:hypothetical protein
MKTVAAFVHDAGAGRVSSPGAKCFRMTRLSVGPLYSGTGGSAPPSVSTPPVNMFSVRPPRSTFSNWTYKLTFAAVNNSFASPMRPPSSRLGPQAVQSGRGLRHFVLQATPRRTGFRGPLKPSLYLFFRRLQLVEHGPKGLSLWSDSPGRSRAPPGRVGAAPSPIPRPPPTRLPVARGRTQPPPTATAGLPLAPGHPGPSPAGGCTTARTGPLQGPGPFRRFPAVDCAYPSGATNVTATDWAKRDSLHVADGVHLTDLSQFAMTFALLKGLGPPLSRFKSSRHNEHRLRVPAPLVVYCPAKVLYTGAMEFGEGGGNRAGLQMGRRVGSFKRPQTFGSTLGDPRSLTTRMAPYGCRLRGVLVVVRHVPPWGPEQIRPGSSLPVTASDRPADRRPSADGSRSRQEQGNKTAGSGHGAAAQAGRAVRRSFHRSAVGPVNQFSGMTDHADHSPAPSTFSARTRQR